MTAIGFSIQQLREERGWTPARLGVEVGLSGTEILRRERGETSVKPRERFAFAKAFDMSIIEFDERWRQYSVPHHPEAPGIPLLNRDPAGYVSDYEEPGVDLGRDCAYIDFDDIGEAAAFGVVVVGSSMTPTFHTGDCLILAPVDIHEPDDKLEPGKIVFLRFSEEHGGGCTLARLRDAGEDRIRLEKDNPAYAPIICRREGIDAMAVAIERREQPRYRSA